MNVLRMNNPLTTEEGIRLDIVALGILILDMLGIPMGKSEFELYLRRSWLEEWILYEFFVCMFPRVRVDSTDY